MEMKPEGKKEKMVDQLLWVVWLMGLGEAKRIKLVDGTGRTAARDE